MNNQLESTGSFVDESYDLFIERQGDAKSEPDLYIHENDEGEKVNSIEITIEPQKSEATIKWDNGDTVNLDNEELDQSIEQLNANISGLSIKTHEADINWNNQKIIKGYDGNDKFDLSGISGDEEDQSGWLQTTFVGTKGYDSYIGTGHNDLVTYRDISKDEILGLFITDTEESLPLVGGNLPPIINEDFQKDTLLVRKESEGTSGVDILKGIELVELSDNKDEANLTKGIKGLGINFGGGHDKASLASHDLEQIIDQYFNLEQLNWEPLTEQGQNILGEDGEVLMYDFTVKEVIEDQSEKFIWGIWPPIESELNDSDWKIEEFRKPIKSGPSKNSKDDGWIKLVKKQPTPEIIANNNVVIAREWKDGNEEDLQWMEIHAYDFRENGEGILGMEVDLEWNMQTLRLGRQINVDDLFNTNHLPLFLSSGEHKTNTEKEILKGISAAGLPGAGMGKTLGNMKSANTETLFAKIPFIIKDHSKNRDIKIKVNMLPAAGGIDIDNDDIVILDDESNDVWLIETNPGQEQVGSHAFTLTRGEGEAKESEHLILTVRNENDAPVSISREQIPENYLNISVLQGQEISHEIDKLFKDDDNEDLAYSIESQGSWLKIDQEKNRIIGIPGNNEVGLHKVKVKAIDRKGKTAEQELTISVWNVNDKPEVGSQISPPDVIQDEKFLYHLPQDAFTDPDFSADEHEKLKYKIIGPSWLVIDEENGIISGRPRQENVGEIIFKVKAIDRQGLSAEQEVKLLVKNTNDSPLPTTEINEFIKRQDRNLDEETTPKINDKYSIYNGISKSININEWFDDPDIGIDPEEMLSYQIELDTGEGELISLNNPEKDDLPNWLVWNEETKDLQFKPSNKEVGKHYLRITAKDQQELNSTVVVPILVRHLNTKPYVNWESELFKHTEQDFKGIKQIQIKDQGFISVELEEESIFNLSLPSDIFIDKDIGIDQEEKLDIRVEEIRDMNGVILDKSFINFNPTQMKISGNTIGKALDSRDGIGNWIVKLKAEDRAGSHAHIDIEFVLKRSAPESKLELLRNNLVVKEDESAKLQDLISIDATMIEGHNIRLEIIHRAEPGQKVDLFDSDGRSIDRIDLGRTGDSSWQFEREASQINELIKGLYFQNQENSNLKEVFKFDIKTTSTLGGTDLETVSELIGLDIAFEPQPEAPKWNINKEYEIKNDYKVEALGDYIEASSEDKNEEIAYIIGSKGNDEKLEFYNRNGERLGIEEGNRIRLTSEEWKHATIRSNESEEKIVELNIVAQSKELSNGLTANSELIEIKWKVTPMINSKGSAYIDIPEEGGKSGVRSNVELTLETPANAINSIAYINIAKGTEILIYGEHKISKQNIDNEIDQYIIEINEEVLRKDKGSIKLGITAPEDFKGLFEGSLISRSTLREDHQKFESVIFENDLINKLSSEMDKISFAWNVYAVAREPEILLENLDNIEGLGVNKKTGRVNIPIRRGASKKGLRNPDEAITITISNIPDGYYLAEKVNGKFKHVGATDTFGTVTLFSETKELPTKSQEELSEYKLLNDGNLYLVKAGEVAGIKDGSTLRIEINSLISSESSHDSRSKKITETIDISDIEAQDANKAIQFIDPLIIDINKDSKIELIDLEDSNIEFTMIPGKNLMRTGWISKQENENGMNAAFIVHNDKANDSGTISISSTAEMFSEYFGSSTGKTMYKSGSEALASLDSNSDSKLNNQDEAWKDIQLWFDNGDAQSIESEFHHIGLFIDSIDLASTKGFMSESPQWSKTNAVLSQTNAYKATEPKDKYQIFDIGFEVKPSTGETIHLDIKEPVAMIEAGQLSALTLISNDGDKWVESKDSDFTLVRVSGIPDEIIPTYGVKDIRGDWLFTWTDVAEANGKFGLVPSVDWSGDANISVMISQVQDNGDIISSAIRTTRLSVEAVADTPVLRIQDQNTEEDIPIALSSFIKQASLRDIDGSEELLFEIHDLPNEFNISLKEGEIFNKYKSHGNIYSFDQTILSSLYILPKKDFSGVVEFDWHAVAKESSGNSSARVVEKTKLYIRAVADTPKEPEIQHGEKILIQGGDINLGTLLVAKPDIQYLSDTDGSESLHLELRTPKNLQLINEKNKSWVPKKHEAKENENIYELSSKEINELKLVDDGSDNTDYITIYARYSSYEERTMDKASSHMKEIKIPFHRNAKPAIIRTNGSISVKEDSKSIKFSEFIAVKPENPNDTLSYRIANLPAELNLVDSGHNKIVNKEGEEYIEMDSLDAYDLKLSKNASGNYTISVNVISKPKGQGSTATTPTIDLRLEVISVADKPRLTSIARDSYEFKIDEDGWVDLSVMDLGVVSDDNDNSEEYDILISVANVNEFTVLPRFNTRAIEIEQGIWSIRAQEASKAKIYLGEIAEDLSIILTPRSVDGLDSAVGDAQVINVKANAIVRRPMLEVKAQMSAFEDDLIPILQESGGVVSVVARGSGVGQHLALEISGLPKGTQLIYKDIKSNANTVVNRGISGELVDTLRLPIEKWKSTYLKPPVNFNGDISVKVQAFSVGNNDQEKSTRTDDVTFSIIPVNDSPIFNSSFNSKNILEGDQLSWNLRSLFIDPDNEANELAINALVIGENGKENLPDWLTLNSNGLLTGTPGNLDVGSLRLDVTATDLLGGRVSNELFLSVGNLNTAPKITYSGPDVLTIDLRESSIISLEGPGGMFDDDDKIHGDSIAYKIKLDDSEWIQNKIEDFISVNDRNLILNPTKKWTVGEHTVGIKAIDNQGAVAIKTIQVTVNNVNDAPIVIRPDSMEVSPGLWVERISISEGEEAQQIKLGDIFHDADINDEMQIKRPEKVPSWITINANNNIEASPENNDVGTTLLEWSATDPQGAKAIYRLELEVLNVNKTPTLDARATSTVIKAKENNYSTFDLGSLFTDEDIIHGDSLRYSIKLYSNDKGVELDGKTGWLDVVYRQPEAPQVDNQLLIQPIFHMVNQDGSTGDKIENDQMSNLSSGTVVRVNINATDYRKKELLGIVGIDLDITMSPSFSLISKSSQISNELPLFNQIIERDNGIRFQAGSAPDGLKIGKPVGDKEMDQLFSFDVILKRPEESHRINISPGHGISRDGILDRYGNQLDGKNLKIHSYASETGADLTITTPTNDDVGMYTIYITAEDQKGLSVTAAIPFEIQNTNDSPTLNKQEADKLALQIGKILEGESKYIENVQLFEDLDLIHNQKYRDYLNVSLETFDNSIPNGIKIASNGNGTVSLNVKPNSGLTEILEQRFRIKAYDNSDQVITTDWLDIAYLPSANLSPLTTGVAGDIRELGNIESGYTSQKNMDIKLSDVLNLNAIDVLDPEGDDVHFVLAINDLNSKLSAAGIEDSKAIKNSINKQGLLQFSVDLRVLSEETGAPLGNLDSLRLRMTDNLLAALPDKKNLDIKTGVAIKIWTESFVRGDMNRLFGAKKSQETEAWIGMENKKPIFYTPENLRIDSEYLNKGNKTLYKLSDIFIDLDNNDALYWNVEIPTALKDYIYFNESQSEIKLVDEDINPAELPSGIHNILINVKDTSGMAGDRSGTISKLLKIVVVNQVERSSSALGLDLLTTMDSREIATLLNDPSVVKTKAEESMLSIINDLGIKSYELEKLSKKLKQGSLAVVQNSKVLESPLLIESNLEEGVLFNAEIEEVSAEVFEDARTLIADNQTVDTPLGEIQFALDTNGQDLGVLNVQLPKDSHPNVLVKTTGDGTPFIFRSEAITYDDEYGTLEEWLDSLTYGVYAYGEEDYHNQANPIFSIKATETDFTEVLLSQGFRESDITNLDGSGFILDVDGDGKADLVRMLLIDQGWFDTRADVVGLIGDPLIPLVVQEVAQVEANPEEDLPIQPSKFDLLNKNTDLSITGSPVNEINDNLDVQSEELGDQIVGNLDTSNEDIDDLIVESIDTSSEDIDDLIIESIDTSNEDLDGQAVENIETPNKDIDGEMAENRDALSADRESQEAENIDIPSKRLSDQENNNAKIKRNVLSHQAHQSIKKSPKNFGNQIKQNQENIFGTPNKVDNDQRIALQNEASSRSNRRSFNFVQTLINLNFKEGDGDSIVRSNKNPINSFISELLDSPGRSSISSMLGLMLGSLTTELIASKTAKQIQPSQELRLKYRSNDFKGKWLILTRAGRINLIERSREGLYINKSLLTEEQILMLERLPGFNDIGVSLLARALPCCTCPGELVKTLPTIFNKLSLSKDPDINWIVWIDSLFESQNSPKNSITALQELRSLVDSANEIDLALGDVIMMSQIHDCAIELGVELSTIPKA